MDTTLDIQYSTSTAWQSAVIRRLTHSPWSHVDIVLPEGLLGVSGVDEKINDLGGVRIRPHKAWPYLTTPKVAHLRCSDTVRDAVIAAAKSQMDKPFDNGSLWSFLQDQAEISPDTPIVERNWRDTTKWFCSELVIWSCAQGGLFPYELVVPKNRITPADTLLMFNPFMSAENIAEFAS